jgi:hypothetical protein
MLKIKSAFANSTCAFSKINKVKQACLTFYRCARSGVFLNCFLKKNIRFIYFLILIKLLNILINFYLNFIISSVITTWTLIINYLWKFYSVCFFFLSSTWVYYIYDFFNFYSKILSWYFLLICCNNHGNNKLSKKLCIHRDKQEIY